MIKRRATLAALLAVMAVMSVGPATAGAGVPPGFFGLSPQGPMTAEDLELMRQSGVTSVRMPLRWGSVERLSPYVEPPDWSGFDSVVALAAEQGIRIFPFAFGTPAWLGADPIAEPAGSSWQLGAWKSFLRRAVERYGAGGSFWSETPDVPYLPVQLWEIWNEENIVTFGLADPARFSRLIRASGRVVHATDPGARVILGGLFGRPLQVPPNVPSGAFLSSLYRQRNVKRFFDGVALHPYVADARAMRGQIRNLRRIMRIHHDGGTPLYVTELGWGSASFESRWERGPDGQAEELDQAFGMLAGHRRAWRIGGAWWFSWTDAYGSCQFCDSAGLLTPDREAKPAWYRFNAWTGGDPDTVPRAYIPG